MVAAQLRSEGVEAISPRSIARWSSDVVDHAPNDWLAALLPAYAGRTAHAPCDEQCWDWYKGHYLTRARPSHRDTYLRLQEMAKEQGWTIPSARTLERRIDAEVSQATQAVLRDGPEAARRLPRVILAAIFAYFGPRFCLGCATSALLTVINKLVEIAIQKGDDELLRNISEAEVSPRFSQ